MQWTWQATPLIFQAMQFEIENRPEHSAELVAIIQAAADSSRAALGFLPAQAYSEALLQQKILVAYARTASGRIYAGHLLHGGTFPHARVFQTYIDSKYRRYGLGTRLLRALVAKLEHDHFLSVKAIVAEDLNDANAFYERNGFAAHGVRVGGQTRNRQLIVRARELETPSFFSAPLRSSSPAGVVTSTRLMSDDPIYLLDLNVFFDVIRNRTRTEVAEPIIAAALAHELRVAVTDEFVAELERTSRGRPDDPVLRFARSLPRCSPPGSEDLGRVCDQLAEIVFPDQLRDGVLSDQDRSDLRHLAIASAVNAGGFITSEEAILRRRGELIEKFSLDVVGPAEFASWLSRAPAASLSEQAPGDLSFQTATVGDELLEFWGNQGVPQDLIRTFGRRSQTAASNMVCVEAREGSQLIASIVWSEPSTRAVPVGLLVVARQDHAQAKVAIDFLIDYGLRQMSRRGAVRINLYDLPSTPLTRRLAISAGFSLGSKPTLREHGTLTKVALGMCVTGGNADLAAQCLMQLAGMKIDSSAWSRERIVLTSPQGASELSTLDFETAFGPCLTLTSSQRGAIVPIRRTFAQDLLGSAQLSLLPKPEASFLARRTYLGTARSPATLSPGTPIVFYESGKQGGRSAAIAVARVIESNVYRRDSIPDAPRRSSVLTPSSLDAISKQGDVLATTFHHLMIFENPVPLKTLKALGADDPANFITSFKIPSTIVEAIAEHGHPHV